MIEKGSQARKKWIRKRERDFNEAFIVPNSLVVGFTTSLLSQVALTLQQSPDALEGPMCGRVSTQSRGRQHVPSAPRHADSRILDQTGNGNGDDHDDGATE